jgi:hypothetical protein
VQGLPAVTAAAATAITVAAIPFFATAAAAATTVAAATAAATTVATATTAAATTVAAATTTATTTATGALFFWTSFINGEITAHEVFAIEPLNRGSHGSWGIHGHKSEATRATAFTVDWEEDVGYGAVLTE